MAPVLVVLFLVVPVVEIYVIVQVGQVLGVLPTVALLLLESALGAWLVKREGRRAWRTLRDAVNNGRLPSRELADAALVLVGGTLLLTPGFVTDVAGFFLVLPVTRPLARRMLGWFLARRASVLVTRRGAARGWSPPAGPGAGPRAPRSGPRVVPGEVVTDRADPGAPGDPGDPGAPDKQGPGRADGG